MFGKIFKTKKYEPLDAELRKYFEQAMLYLENTFSEPLIVDRKLFLPTDEDFPIKWDNSEKNAEDVLKIICENMQIDFEEVELFYYKEGITEISTGSSVLFLQNDEKEKTTAGLYHGKNENGKYEISINETTLQNPVALIATMAHELSHLKLIEQTEEHSDDEYFTDTACVFFGFGIFAANASFLFSQQFDRWGYQTIGYLQYDEWAYCLALFAYIREDDSPTWTKYLNATVKSEFEKCLKYMLENQDDIFKFEEENNENEINL